MTPFEQLTRGAFGYLESEFGLRVCSSAPEHIRYEGLGVFVDVRFDAGRSFELGVEVGQLNRLFNGSERGFSLGEVLRAVSAPEADPLSLVQVTSEEALERFLGVMAWALRSHGVALLRGDDEAYNRLGLLRDQESSAYRRERDRGGAIERARRAWRQRDFVGVIDALSPFEDDLPPSEKKRLDVARARVA